MPDDDREWMAPVRDIDVVVVSYESDRLLGPCLASLRGSDRVARVVVVDNASAGTSAEVSRAVAAEHGAEWIQMGTNLGFGRAANRGIAATDAPLVCVLNPDLVVQGNALDRIAAALDGDASLGVAAPTVRSPDGSLYPSVRRFPDPGDAIGHATLGLLTPNNPWTRRYRSVGDPAHPDWVSGTAMVLRRSAVEAVGCFDERYFLYVEDLDLCWRLRRAGWEIGLVGDAVVVHEQGHSARRHPYRTLVDHHRSAWRFVRMSTAGAERAALPVYGFGLGARLAVAIAKVAIAGRRAGR